MSNMVFVCFCIFVIALVGFIYFKVEEKRGKQLHLQLPFLPLPGGSHILQVYPLGVFMRNPVALEDALEQSHMGISSSAVNQYLSPARSAATACADAPPHSFIYIKSFMQ